MGSGADGMNKVEAQDQRFMRIAEQVGRLVAKKNIAYGDSFAKSGDILKILYPQGIEPHQYTDALATVRIIDKLMRIATRKNAFSESPYRDIAGYGILGAAKDEGSNDTPIFEGIFDPKKFHQDSK